MKKRMTAVMMCAVLLLSGCGGRGTAGKPESTSVQTDSGAGHSKEEPAGQPIALTEEYWEARIGPGYYRIGTDIPLGVMDITAISGSGHISSSDGMLDIDMKASENSPESMTEGELLAKQLMAGTEKETPEGLPDLESVDTLTDEEMQRILSAAQQQGETDYYPGIGFMEGVVLTVTGAVRLHLILDNCDVSGMKKRSLIGDTISLGEGEYTAGEDFEAGTYVITVTGGIGSVSAKDGSMFVYMGYPSEEGINSDRFMNYSCREGDVLVIDGVTVELQQVSG